MGDLATISIKHDDELRALKAALAHVRGELRQSKHGLEGELRRTIKQLGDRCAMRQARGALACHVWPRKRGSPSRPLPHPYFAHARPPRRPSPHARVFRCSGMPGCATTGGIQGPLSLSGAGVKADSSEQLQERLERLEAR